MPPNEPNPTPPQTPPEPTNVPPEPPVTPPAEAPVAPSVPDQPAEPVAPPDQAPLADTPPPPSQPQVFGPQPAAVPDANSTPVTGGAAPTPPSAPSSGKGKLKLILAIVIVVVVLGGAGAGAYMWYKQQNSPDHIFKTAVSNLFKTKSVTQTAASSDVNGSVKYDVANITDPKISADVSVKSSDVTFHMSTYGTLQNSYLKFNSFGNSTLDNYFSDVTNKWVQLRKDGTVPANVNTNFSDLADPRVFAFGDFIFGNFSNSQQKTLTDFVISNDIYKYDSKAVTTTTLDGKKTYVYPITENVSKLKDLNTMAAGYMGLKASDIKTALDNLGGNDSVKLYVDASTKEFVKVTLTNDGSPLTNTYTYYDATTLPNQPSADITWAQLESAFGNSL